MKELLEFLLKGITGKADFLVEETIENGRVDLKICADPENVGIIIGKNGGTIKAIQNILRVRARLKKTSVFIDVTEKK
jgi:predicted RNA-binding protein YlqC (UPF0109 family)